MPKKQSYAAQVSTKATSGTERTLGRKDEVKNTAGGYVFKVDSFERLERFLILGNEGGTYYASERKLTKENAECVLECLAKDRSKTIQTIAGISAAGRAPKNDAAIFALALCASADQESRKLALQAMPEVCRTGTHLFQFAAACDQLRGWGQGLRKAIGKWYSSKTPSSLAYQVVKYQQRGGWSHRDLMRLAHKRPAGELYQLINRWVVKGEQPQEGTSDLAIIEGFERAKRETDPKVVAGLVTRYGLTWEMVPTEALNSVDVWAALLDKMPLNAMVRNLGKMTKVGLLKPMSDAVKLVRGRLLDQEYIHKSRMHPIPLLIAQRTYAQGHGEKGSLKWDPVQALVTALDDAFYLAFKNCEPTGKRQLIALDVSGSMGTQISGYPISCREAAAAMAMVTMRTEDEGNYYVVGFTSESGGMSYRYNDTALVPLKINPKMTLEQVCAVTGSLPFGGTDCSLPMQFAKKHNMKVDAFVTLTDNEHWAGSIKPFQALEAYRKHSGINAKAIAYGMTATDFTVLDPKDPGSLNIVGFDTAGPQLAMDFVRG